MINGEEITDSNIITKNAQKLNAKDFLTGTHNCIFQFKNIGDISIIILIIINELPNKSSREIFL